MCSNVTGNRKQETLAGVRWSPPPGAAPLGSWTHSDGNRPPARGGGDRGRPGGTESPGSTLLNEPAISDRGGTGSAAGKEVVGGERKKGTAGAGGPGRGLAARSARLPPPPAAPPPGDLPRSTPRPRESGPARPAAAAGSSLSPPRRPLPAPAPPRLTPPSAAAALAVSWARRRAGPRRRSRPKRRRVASGALGASKDFVVSKPGVSNTMSLGGSFSCVVTTGREKRPLRLRPLGKQQQTCSRPPFCNSNLPLKTDSKKREERNARLRLLRKRVGAFGGTPPSAGLGASQGACADLLGNRRREGRAVSRMRTFMP